MLSFKKSPNLLGIGSDAKTVKGEKVGVLTGVMYFAPYNVSSFQVCPKASEGCKAACLFTAGRGKMSNVQQARINKTRWFMQERSTFLEKLVYDVAKLERKANREDMVAAVRLNGASDIAWEKFRVVRDGVTYRNIMLAFPEVQFYDYTKIVGRKAALALPNYHLTFSLSEDNDSDAKLALEQGYNVAVVMNLHRSADKPATWSGYPVVNGDETDVRFFDPKGGHIVALFAKGDASKDETGFVREPDSSLANFPKIKLQLAA